MPSREWRLRIQDILQAAQDIQQFTDSITFEEFKSNKLITQSVLYNFVIIGEASASIPDEIREIDPTIPLARLANSKFKNC
jgi:uncharacterized protein with HEPN domain